VKLALLAALFLSQLACRTQRRWSNRCQGRVAGVFAKLILLAKTIDANKIILTGQIGTSVKLRNGTAV
jgi:hypothetical protein